MSLSLLQANCSWRERGSDRKRFQPYALCLFSIMQCRAVMAEPVANTGKAWKNKPTSWSCWSAALLPQVHCVHFSFNQVELWLVVQAPDFHRKSARVTRKRPGATKAQVTAIARQEIIEIVWFEWLWWSYIYQSYQDWTTGHSGSLLKNLECFIPPEQNGCCEHVIQKKPQL